VDTKIFASFFEISFSFNDHFQQLNGCLFNFKTLKQYPIYFDQSYIEFFSNQKDKKKDYSHLKIMAGIGGIAGAYYLSQK